MTTTPAPADDITLPALPEGTFCSDLPGHIGYPASGLRAYARAAVKLDRQRGDEKRHFICVCPDCTKPADRASTSRAGGWISVEDRLPEAKTEVLVAFAEQAIPSTGQYTGSPHDQGGWCYPSENRWTGLDGADPTITHWMPLPAAPGQAALPAAVDVGAAQAETAQAAPAAALTDEQILAGYRAMLSCIEFFGPDAAIAAFRAATPGATHGNN